jgi:hypothetical protein
MNQSLDSVFTGLEEEQIKACMSMVHVLVNTLNAVPVDSNSYNIRHAAELAQKSKDTLIAVLGEASVNALIEGVLRGEEDAMAGVDLLIGENFKNGKYKAIGDANGTDAAIELAKSDFMETFHNLIEKVKETSDLTSTEHESNKNNLKIVIATILRYSLTAGVIRAGDYE